MLVSVATAAGDETLVKIPPSRRAIVSWNTRALEGRIELRVGASDGRTTPWLPYVAFAANERRSRNGHGTFARIDTDIVRGDVDLGSLGIRPAGEIDAIYVATPDYGAPSGIVALPALALDVPFFSQYVARAPLERGWCAPASLAMLLAHRGYPLDVDVVAREVFDSAYGGTGNWTMNAAFAGTLGFRAAVMFLRDLAHAHAFLAEDIPLALSIAWERDELPGAPLERSNGHVVVLVGISADGDPIVNDPARGTEPTIYPRVPFERLWVAHGGIAIGVVPAPRETALLSCANA